MADSLRLLNTKLVEKIIAMSGDELWMFLLSRMEQIEELNREHKAKTWLFHCLRGGFAWYRNCFFYQIEDERINFNYTIVLDLCFEGAELKLDYYGTGGFYDNADSCGVSHSDDIMPEMDEDSDEYDRKKSFYLLGASHLDKIIQAMEKNAGQLTVNTPEDIDTIKAMREKCARDADYKVAYIYYEW